MSDRKRGSIVDVVNLTKFEFDFEPVTKERQRTNFAKRDVIGRRLSNHLWVGCGDSELQLEIFLLGPDTDSKVALLKSWLRAQSDTGAPHPFYINIGSQYVGKRYLLLEVDNEPPIFTYADGMSIQETRVRLRLDEIEDDTVYTGLGGIQ